MLGLYSHCKRYACVALKIENEQRKNEIEHTPNPYLRITPANTANYEDLVTRFRHHCTLQLDCCARKLMLECPFFVSPIFIIMIRLLWMVYCMVGNGFSARKSKQFEETKNSRKKTQKIVKINPDITNCIRRAKLYTARAVPFQKKIRSRKRWIIATYICIWTFV